MCTQILSFKFDEARYLQLEADTTSGPMPADTTSSRLPLSLPIGSGAPARSNHSAGKGGGARLTALGGSLVSNNTAFSVNGYAVAGGLAIDTVGTVVLSASAVDGSTARAEGSGSAYGGGVLTFGTLTASDGASISSNTAVSVNGQVQGGGLAINSVGTAVLSASSVDGNKGAFTEGEDEKDGEDGEETEAPAADIFAAAPAAEEAAALAHLQQRLHS